MKITKKLVIVIAGLSLGACSSMEGNEDNTDNIYEELQSDILSYDEQPQPAQENVETGAENGIDGLEAEISELTNNTPDITPADTTQVETVPIYAMSYETTPAETAPIETAPIEAMSFDTAAIDAMIADENDAVIEANPIITPAPILSENSLNNSEIVADPEPLEVAPLAVAPQPQPATSRFTYGVQVASYSNREAVIRGWNALLKKDPTSFSGLQPLVNQQEIQGRTLHQLKVGPFLNKPFSDDFCEKLKEKGTDCFVTQYSGDVLTVN